MLLILSLDDFRDFLVPEVHSVSEALRHLVQVPAQIKFKLAEPISFGVLDRVRSRTIVVMLIVNVAWGSTA